MLFQNVLNKAEAFPRQLFIIDGIGALLSAFFLGVILVKLENYFGIPPSALYFLAVFPLIFALYDLYSYNQRREKIESLLKGIAILNLLYSGLSLSVAIFHLDFITALGWAYILFEVLIVVLLAWVELNTARKLIAG